MKEKISHKLKELEAEFGVKVLFAVESGSRAWGFASKDSDWDVRFVYVHPMKWYMSIEEGRDVIERMYPEDNIDVAGWDLRKALKLLRRSNPSFFEWLNSPIVYYADPFFLRKMEEVALDYFDIRSAFHHYYHIGVNHNDRYISRQGYVLKRFLYYFRSMLACDWIRTYSTPPEVDFQKLVSAVVTDKDVLAAIDRMLQLKKESKEHNEEIVEDVLINYAENLRSEQEEYMNSSLPEKECKEPEALDAVFLELLKAHNLNF